MLINVLYASLFGLFMANNISFWSSFPVSNLQFERAHFARKQNRVVKSLAGSEGFASRKAFAELFSEKRL